MKVKIPCCNQLECFGEEINALILNAYTNDDDRLANASDSIPEAHFKDLIDYWNLDEIQVSLFNSQYKIFKYRFINFNLSS